MTGRSSSTKTSERRSRQELRDIVLEAGLEILAATGPLPNIDGLTYKTVFAHLQETQNIRVTHASVHERIWRDQTAYQIDVLRRAADALPAATFLSETGEAAKVVDTADLTTADGRMWSTMEMIRISCNGDIASTDFTLSTFQAIRQVVARMPKDHPDRAELATTVRETRQRIADEYLQLFQFLVMALHLRVRPELELSLDDALRSLFAQVVALADGFVLDGPDENTLTLPTGRHGEPQHWHLYSWSVWCAARTLLEPDIESD